MFKNILYCSILFMLGCSTKEIVKDSKPQNWTNYVRTAGHGLDKEKINAVINDAVNTHLFGIEVDNDIPGRYESFLDPSEKLEAIKLMATRAHEIGNYAFVYVAGLECITAHADSSEHTLFKDHPDWVQRDINNRPAMFGGGDAFWITSGDEDVWVSPYAPEWRKKYMERIRQIAATGIDGIYVDIPYWMTHFNGWTKTWASFDDYTVEAFKKKTGLDARKDLKLGDFSDANFRKWVDFRIETLTRFMAEIAKTAKSVNPDCKTIAEIYPGIGEEAVRVGSDVYEMYKVVDVIAHEYSVGGGNSASKNPQDWFQRMIGMYTFRAFAEGKASWMLSYSWKHDNKVGPIEPMKNQALSNLIAGTNNWDARESVMSGSNDIETRKEIYQWIAQNDSIFYKPRIPIAPIGVYFSPETRNYYADSFVEAYQGIMEMMLQGHMEFQIVTPRTMKDFKGKVLILPDVKCVSAVEASQFGKYIADGNGLIITGETGRYDDKGEEYKENIVFKTLNIPLPKEKLLSTNEKKKFIYYPQCPGKIYSKQIKSEFNEAAWSSEYQNANFFSYLNNFKKEIYGYFNFIPKTIIEASPFISTQIAMVEGKPHVFLANYSGLKSDEIVNQIPEKGIKIHFSGKEGSSVIYLPFLGKKQKLESQFQDGKVVCSLPEVEKGGVVWLED